MAWQSLNAFIALICATNTLLALSAMGGQVIFMYGPALFVLYG
jgi:hypothetical protein